MPFFSDEQIDQRNRKLNKRAKLGNLKPGRPEREVSATDAQIETFRKAAPEIAKKIVADVRKEFDMLSFNDIIAIDYKDVRHFSGIPLDQKSKLENILRIAVITEAEDENFELWIEQDESDDADDELFGDVALVKVRVIIPT